jgi:CRISPR/Cas system-associated exonuclease Cas4 (RecB family)
MIIEKILEAKAKKIKQYPVNSNRASDLGNPCLKYHVFNRTKWQEKSLHDVGLQMVFDMGNAIEDIVLKELAEAGVKVIEQQRAFTWPEYQISGHCDGKIVTDDGIYPMEIKSCSPYVFKSINTINDMINGKYGYLRKYPAQLTLYMLMDNKEKAVFIFKDKSSGAMKEIWFNLDYQLGETLLKRAEAINKHIAAGTLPEPINQEIWCGNCPFAHICLPVQIGKEVEIDTGDLAELLDRQEELKPAVKEYDEIDEQIKSMVEGKEKILAGNWFITGKWQERKSYDVPADIKAAYEKITKYWRRKVQRVDEGKEAA